MPKSVRASTLTALYAKLGFNENDFPGREQKKIAAELQKYPLDRLNQGTPRRFYIKHSQEAKDLAIEFCEKDQRAQRLWPQNFHNCWPSWSDEEGRSMCVTA